MSISRKYGRTYHYPFSPGTTSDDRISHGYWCDIQAIGSLVHTEKLGGDVRRGHVKTDEHWTRNWKRARLRWEYPAEKII
jgi:hypothetical protein